MHTQETIEVVFRALLDPSADFLDAAAELGVPLTEFLEIAESPQITEAIEALEKLAAIRERALLARASHTAIAALERIADSDPETPGARETARKAAAQLLRMSAKAEAAASAAPNAVPLRPAEGVAESAAPGDTSPRPAAARSIEERSGTDARNPGLSNGRQEATPPGASFDGFPSALNQTPDFSDSADSDCTPARSAPH